MSKTPYMEKFGDCILTVCEDLVSFIAHNPEVSVALVVCLVLAALIAKSMWVIGKPKRRRGR